VSSPSFFFFFFGTRLAQLATVWFAKATKTPSETGTPESLQGSSVQKTSSQGVLVTELYQPKTSVAPIFKEQNKE